MAHVIWKEIMPIIYLTRKMSKKFLVQGFNMREEYPMMKEFANVDSPIELLRRLKDCVDSTESKLFRGEHKEG